MRSEGVSIIAIENVKNKDKYREPVYAGISLTYLLFYNTLASVTLALTKTIKN